MRSSKENARAYVWNETQRIHLSGSQDYDKDREELMDAMNKLMHNSGVSISSIYLYR